KCNQLFEQCNSCSRLEETKNLLQWGLDNFKEDSSGMPYVLENSHDGQLYAFTTGLDHGGYTVAVSEKHVQTLLENYRLINGPQMHLAVYVSATRYPNLLRWILQDRKKFRLDRSVTLMAKGWFSPPSLVYLPNIVW